MLASPLPYNQDAVGVVAVLSERSRPWSPANELALLAFTDLAALLIASIIQGEQQSEVAGQLQGALNSRQVIEQAKGILMGTRGISARTAYDHLRAKARSERRKLAEVCAEIVQDAVRSSLTGGASCYTMISSLPSRPDSCGPCHADGCPRVVARSVATTPPDSGRPSPRLIG